MILDTEGVETYAGYAGHAIIVTVYEPDPSKPLHSVERILAQDVFTGADHDHKEIVVRVGAALSPIRLSIRLRCDTTVNPGLYDDFVWRRLSLLSPGFEFYGSLGFPS